MDTTRLCVACRHFMPRDPPHADACAKAEYVEPVYGKHKFWSCVSERGAGGGCGPEGRRFELVPVPEEARG